MRKYARFVAVLTFTLALAIPMMAEVPDCKIGEAPVNKTRKPTPEEAKHFFMAPKGAVVLMYFRTPGTQKLKEVRCKMPYDMPSYAIDRSTAWDIPSGNNYGTEGWDIPYETLKEEPAGDNFVSIDNSVHDNSVHTTIINTEPEGEWVPRERGQSVNCENKFVKTRYLILKLDCKGTLVGVSLRWWVKGLIIAAGIATGGTIAIIECLPLLPWLAAGGGGGLVAALLGDALADYVPVNLPEHAVP